MQVKGKTSKLVVVESYGVIGELGGINGPILNPAMIDIDIIVAMINKGRKVYEVNPKDHTQKTRLSLKNVRSIIYDVTAPASVTMADVVVPKTTPVEENTVDEVVDVLVGDFTKK